LLYLQGIKSGLDIFFNNIVLILKTGRYSDEFSLLGTSSSWTGSFELNGEVV
jgi:hypothetical protein